VLDYVGYRTDFVIGRHLLHSPPLPFFADKVFVARATHFAQLDGFTTPTEFTQYLRDANALVQLDLVQLNAQPVVVNHSMGSFYND
jgi:hypothetical protein